mmetsp:Transcript_5502/g.24437  ORF Transcript_5502/g.24437 Transcript_5502/m.24437 type:complete len:363 (-) Transcript_5502:57-1145(-)
MRVLPHRRLRGIPGALPQVRRHRGGRRPGEGDAGGAVRRVYRGAVRPRRDLVRAEPEVFGQDAATRARADGAAGGLCRLFPRRRGVLDGQVVLGRGARGVLDARRQGDGGGGRGRDVRVDELEDSAGARGPIRRSALSMPSATKRHRRRDLRVQRAQVPQRHAGHRIVRREVPRGSRAVAQRPATRVDHMRGGQHRVLVLLGRSTRLGLEPANVVGRARPRGWRRRRVGGAGTLGGATRRVRGGRIHRRRRRGRGRRADGSAGARVLAEFLPRRRDRQPGDASVVDVQAERALAAQRVDGAAVHGAGDHAAVPVGAHPRREEVPADAADARVEDGEGLSREKLTENSPTRMKLPSCPDVQES